MSTVHALEEDTATVSIANKGRRSFAKEARERSEGFLDGQRFRAGVC